MSPVPGFQDGETMKRCPHCGCDLTSGALLNGRPTPASRGPPRAGGVVNCPECEGTIDGLATA